MFYLDDVAVVNSGLPTPTPPLPGQGPALSVDAASDQHAISPYIYGMNFATEELAADLDLPARRWGGNSTSRYNGRTIPPTPAATGISRTCPRNWRGRSLHRKDRRTGTKTVMTVPLIGWVSKRRPTGHPYDCGFKISVVWRSARRRLELVPRLWKRRANDWHLHHRQ